MRRAVVVAVCGALMGGFLSVLGASPAWAAPPANDTLAGAVVVGPLPFSHSQSTTEATSDAFETSLNEFCGAPAVEHGVWFTATPTVDAFVGIDTTGSDYSAGIMVFEGTPTPEGLLACGPGILSGPVTAGTTYNILIFGDGLTEATSGNLVLEISEAPPPPDIQVTVDPIGSFDKFGVAHLTGTVTCTSADSGQIEDLFGVLQQRAGRVLITGFFDLFLGAPCDGSAVPWDAFVSGDNGLFRGGKSLGSVSVVACNDFGCNSGFADQIVKLSGPGGGKKGHQH